MRIRKKQRIDLKSNRQEILDGSTEPGLEKTMTENDQKQLGKTLWNIADQLRGAMNADDFRDYMLAFLFLLTFRTLLTLKI